MKKSKIQASSPVASDSDSEAEDYVLGLLGMVTKSAEFDEINEEEVREDEQLSQMLIDQIVYQS